MNANFDLICPAKYVIGIQAAEFVFVPERIHGIYSREQCASTQPACALSTEPLRNICNEHRQCTLNPEVFSNVRCVRRPNDVSKVTYRCVNRK